VDVADLPNADGKTHPKVNKPAAVVTMAPKPKLAATNPPRRSHTSTTPSKPRTGDDGDVARSGDTPDPPAPTPRPAPKPAAEPGLPASELIRETPF
jgi:hypothetical protein